MTIYPSGFDTDTEIPSVHDNVSEVSGNAINAIRAAIFAIQRTLGLEVNGSEGDLTERLDRSLNDDGTIKSSALASAGLASLPIDNSHISASAGIEESKLDLDFSTQSLKNDIASNDVDIANLSRTLADLLVKYTRHVAGSADKHASEHVTHALADGYLSGVGTNVKTALNYLYGEMIKHRTNDGIIEHLASAIKYIPFETVDGETTVITADNVQDAIASIEIDFIEDRRKHNDEAHSDGISNDGYVALLGQALVNDASLRLARYQPNATRDVIKLGLCNAPSIKSKGFDPTKITSSAHSVIVKTKISGVTRSITISNIHLLAYPPGNSKISLDGVVDYFNAAFANAGASAHFPVTAFPSDDGEIVLQLNMDIAGCTISVSSPGGSSATTALGFAEILDNEVGYLRNYSFLVNGSRFTELKTLASGAGTNGGLGSIDLGVDVSPDGLDLAVGSLIHIYDHSTPAANGTYQINSILPSDTEITLTESMTAGTFNFIIYADTFSTTQFSGSDIATLDFYIDSSRDLYVSARAVIDYQSTSGFSIVEVSENFPVVTGMNLSVSTDGNQKFMVLSYSTGEEGHYVLVRVGYIGYVKIYGPDNISYLTLYIDNPVVSNGVVNIDTALAERSDNRMFLGTSHITAGTATIEMPLNRRPVGLVGKTSLSSDLRENVLERDIRNLNSNGIIRGFEIFSSNNDKDFSVSNTIVVQGGTAYIAGRFIEKARAEIDIDATNTGIYNLVLHKNGNYEIFEDAAAIYGMQYIDIVTSADRILIAQITVNGSEITAGEDARFFVNNVQSKQRLTVDDRDSGTGVFRTLTAAAGFARNSIDQSGKEIFVLTDLIAADDLVIDNSTHVVCLGLLRIGGNLTIDNNSSLTVFEDFVTEGNPSTIIISDNSELVIHGTAEFDGPVTISENSTLILGSTTTFADAVELGLKSGIIGNDTLPSVTFAGNNDGILISDSGAFVSDLAFVMDSSVDGRYPIIRLNNDSVGFVAKNSTFIQSGDIDSANWTTNLATDYKRSGIMKETTGLISGLEITDCIFSNLAIGVYIVYATNPLVSRCKFEDSYISMGVAFASHPVLQECSYSRFLNTAMSLTNNTGGVVRGNEFTDEYDVGEPPEAIINADSPGIIISDNYFHDIRVEKIIESSEELIFSNNYCSTITCTDMGFDLLSDAPPILFSGNIINDHTGVLIQGSNLIMSGNRITVIAIFGGENLLMTVAGSITGNIINLPDNSEVSVTDSGSPGTSTNFSLNTVLCGSVDISSSQNHVQLLDNALTLATAPVEIASNTGEVYFKGNRVLTTGSFSALVLNDEDGKGGPDGRIGVIQVCSNYLETADALHCVTLGTAGESSSARWMLNGNVIVNGTSTGLNIFADNVSITANIFSGTGVHDIYINSDASNVYVSDNVLTVGEIGLDLTNPPDVFIGRNKNMKEKMAFSPMGGFQETGTEGWETVSDKLTSLGNAGAIYVPLLLPVGAFIEKVEVLCNASVLDSINITLYARNTTGNIGAGIVSETTPAGHGNAFLTLTPSIDTYVLRSNEYFLKITSETVGDTLSQAVVTVIY